MIKVDNLSLRYKNRILTNNININFEIGKIYCIFGESGSGKSSLLKAIAGVNDNYTGNIIINKSAKDDMFYIDSNNYFFKNNTVLDNIKILTDNQKEIDYYIKRYNLDKILNQKMKYCSLGEKKRVILVCMFLNKKKINLLDETLTNIDDNYLNIVFEDLKKLKEHSLIIIVTHFKDKVGEISDYVIDFESIDNVKIDGNDDNNVYEHTKIKGNILRINNQKYLNFVFLFLVTFFFFMSLFIGDRIIDQKQFFSNAIKDNDSICFNLKEYKNTNVNSILNRKYSIIFKDEFKIDDKTIDLSDTVIISNIYRNQKNDNNKNT